MKLAEFYEAANVERALEGYRSSVPTTWGAVGRLELYRSAKVAFQSDAPEDERRSEFGRIYSDLRRYWQVFRNAGGTCWSADETFSMLTTQCEPVSRQSGLTAKNLVEVNHTDRIRACLVTLGPIKPSRYFPWMATSKFLHFFNPSLFPIYDDRYVWKKVATGAFRQDYNDFCRRHGFQRNPLTVQFSVQYVLWGSEIIQTASDECMPIFARWFASQVDDQSARAPLLQDLEQYYAAAFEAIAVGAAFLSTR